MSDETQYVVHLRVTMSGPDVEWAEVASTLAGRARALGAFRVGRYVGGAARPLIVIDTVEIDTAGDE